jgi:hypothetical protein
LGVNHICTHPSVEEEVKGAKPELTIAARFQLIFVDYLLMTHALKTSATRHVFDPRFDTILKEEERVFKHSFLDFMEKLPEKAYNSAAFQELQQHMVNKMGFEQAHFREGGQQDKYRHLREVRQPRAPTEKDLSSRSR